jgi:peptide/nickel transport system permease protein
LSRGLVGGTVVVVMTILAIVAPALPLPNPVGSDLDARLKPPTGLFTGHPLGTDQLGRDLLSRIVHGARVSLAIGFATVFIAGTVGVLLGLVAGYVGGWSDHVIMRIVDIQLAFPFLVMALALVAVLRPSVFTVIGVLTLWGWIVYCRLVRGAVLSLREKEFITAARVVGCTGQRILLRHILPNTLSGVLVLAAYQVAQMMVAEASLSFLGLGVPPPTPSWGSIIGQGREYISTAWWVTTFPGLVLTVTVIGVGFLGDWLRDRIDPQFRARR